MNQIKKLQLFHDVFSIEEVKKGYKKRKKYIVETTNGKYFVKVLPYRASNDEIEKTKWIYEAFEEANIPLVPLLDMVVEGNKTFLIYNYFEGKNLKESRLSLKQYESYGRKVSLEVKKMNEIKNYPPSFRIFDLKNHCNNYVERLKKVMYKKRDKLLHLFSEEEIYLLITRFQKLSIAICNDEVMLNHNDIKIANIMVDHNNDFYFVDIEPIDLTYKGFNINYSIYTFLLNNDYENNEKAFIKGFVKEYDIDKKLVKEMEYFMISDFINELESLLDKYYDYLEKNISFIKKILFNEEGLLIHILYD